MMTDRLLQQVGQMQDVYRLEQIKKNKAAQEKANAGYSAVLEQAHRLTKTLYELKTRLSFSLKQETISALTKTLVQLKEVPLNGLPTQERLDDVNRIFKQVENTIRLEWKKYHASITASPLRILQIAQALDPERCQAVIQALRDGADWTSAPKGFQPFFDALNQSKDIIKQMNVSEVVIGFLERMNRGTATIADLNPEVLEWLSGQLLMDKIYLIFGRP